MMTRKLVHGRRYALAAALVATACLITMMIPANRAHTATTDVMPALRGGEAVSYLKQHGLHSSLGEAMAAARYGVHWSEHTPWKELPGAFYAGNPAQQMTAFFTGEGIHLESRSANHPKWQMGMKLTGLGYGERLLRVSPGEMKVKGNRVEISKAVVGGQWSVASKQNYASISPSTTDNRPPTTDHRPLITEWYVNRAEGIEQGFIVDAAPDERREGERLTLRLVVEGDLKAKLADDGEAIDLIARGRERRLRYDKLHVYDAAGRELEARMRVEDGQVMLEVEEREAVYPLTIDPVFSLQQQLTASDGGAGDLFGFSVAISGETVVVGAIGDNVGATVDQGSAYVFVRTGAVWNEQQHLTVSDGAAGDFFGNSVAISGETVVIGARSDNAGANVDQGSAYVFVRTGAVWNEQQHLTASDGGAGDLFGVSIAISGETVVVGAISDDVGANSTQGSAYVFVRTGAAWSQQQKLTASDGAANDVFGVSIAISGETVIVGAESDSVGTNVDQGSAYVFVRTGAVWNEQQKLTASDGGASDFFGNSVAISGETVVVGAESDDVGANSNQGSAYVFVRTGAVWNEQQHLTASDGAAGDFFGFSVAIDGETVVIGSESDDIGANANQGSAYVFVRTGAVWNEQQHLTASDGATGDLFGLSVAISGETVVVGAESDDVGANSTQGSAYIFFCDTPPMITTSPVTIQQGQAVTGAAIATVFDNEDAASALVVSVVTGGTAAGVALTYIVNTSGAITADVAVSCTATSGTVRLRVTDSGGLFAEADLQVNVTANAPPLVTCPANIAVSNTPGQCSATVNFTATASDDCDGTLTPTCLPASGSSFNVGTTTVTCTATDSSSQTGQCSFTVTVNDTQPPAITCPANLMVKATPGSTTAWVNYPPPTATDNCGVMSVSCLPPSGSTFPVGITTVTCTATDSAGNKAQCSFTVTTFDVCLEDDSNPARVLLWNSATGDYRFCYTGGMLTGKGIVTRKGNVFNLVDSKPDRRVQASLDASARRGSASLQSPPGQTRCSITDRNTTDNSCSCGAGS